MIKVGFVLYRISENTLGVINYFNNLINAILDIPNRKIEPVLFAGQKANFNYLSNIPCNLMFFSKLFDVWNLENINKKLHYVLYNFAVSILLKKYKIDVLSHANFSGLRLPLFLNLPTIGWIGDFQHKHLPQFFSNDEIKARDQHFLHACRTCDRIVVSSRSAQSDLMKYYPNYVAKSRVLQFVPPIIDSPISKPELEEKYHFQGPYFFVPNHFWIHKNHRLIIEAQKILQKQGRTILVIAVGKTDDVRHQDHFTELLNLIHTYGLQQQFKILGIVPYHDLIALLKYSMALINPSLFEGWSSTVEEARSLGKKVILSDIPVHREQNPRRGVFFNPSDAEGLAKILWQAQEDYCPEEEPQHYHLAKMENRQRWTAFGVQYQNIVLELCSALR